MLERISWPLRDRFCLVLGDGVVHLLRQRAWTWQPTAQLLETKPLASHVGMDTVRDVLQALLLNWPTQGLGLHIVLGADWVQFAQIEPPLDARQRLDLEAAAAMQLQKMLDSTAADTASVCEPWLDAPYLGCAMQRPLLAVLAEVAAARRMPLCGVVPEFSLVWNHWCKALQRGEWLGVYTRHGWTLGVVAHGRLQAVRHKRGAADTAAWQDAWLSQEALRCHVQEPSGLAVCGLVPLSWTTAERGVVSRRVLGEAADALAVLGVRP